ncbi:hypothetical protein ZWY2020_022390 [Hordeum vulgare]|nr:hypothetical protein ZWY2020_022390 [Hordeum vulgare]
MTASEEQVQETAVAAKRRVSQPTKKAQNVAAGDREPEFLGEPVPADEAICKATSAGLPSGASRISSLSCFSFRPIGCFLLTPVSLSRLGRPEEDEDMKARIHYRSAKVNDVD